MYSRGQLLRTSFRKKNRKKNRKWHGVSKCELRTRNQNDGVLSSHLEPRNQRKEVLSTRYLEPPPCCNGYQSKKTTTLKWQLPSQEFRKTCVFLHVFNHCLFDLSAFFIYMFIHVYLFVSSNFEKIEVLSMRFSKEWSHFGVYSRL